MISSSAPGKAILCGEHAVVYGQPAIALPIGAVSATATVERGGEAGVVIETPDVGGRLHLRARPDHPLASLARETLAAINAPQHEPLKIVLRSTIPIGGGMGSGAALGAALVQALAAYHGAQLDPATVSALVYASERFYHGTPSGIDNTVVSFAQPIWYQRDREGAPRLEPLVLGGELTLIIADTGMRCPTHVTVGKVRERRAAEPEVYDTIFVSIGRIVEAVRSALHNGDIRSAGALLDENHRLLQALGVSTAELDRLVGVARQAGALGAKLSGGGGGGIMLALTDAERPHIVETALRLAGAARVIVTQVTPSGPESVLV
jgi:mevalonate kinase